MMSIGKAYDKKVSAYNRKQNPMTNVMTSVFQ